MKCIKTQLAAEKEMHSRRNLSGSLEGAWAPRQGPWTEPHLSHPAPSSFFLVAPPENPGKVTLEQFVKLLIWSKKQGSSGF